MNSHYDPGMNPVFAHTTVPIDGSTTAERGVAFALELARDGGLVTFCSVVDPSLVLTTLDDDAAEFCRQARAKAAEAGITAEGHVLHGQCVDAIDALVRGNASQAIVVGTHGRTGFARTVLGSVAEGLVRRSDVPVVAVHEDDLVRTGPIGVAFDESPAAHAALGVATAIALARGIPLALIHASDPPGEDASRLETLLTGAAKRARGRGVRSDVIVRNGRAADAILAAADELECCMIVMGTHGRSLFERLILGSVAAGVVEHARVPVVTARRAISS